jgi:hypothetical protein
MAGDVSDDAFFSRTQNGYDRTNGILRFRMNYLNNSKNAELGTQGK